ncbi:MAG: hypothetical protein J6D34_11945 [Atopobiaceae bacterium]|nr:hypothetical protein [Atopobiaceae bacterium]
MHAPLKVLAATMTAAALTLSLAACGGQKDLKDPVVNEKSRIIEDEDKNLSEQMWSLDGLTYGIMLDVEDGRPPREHKRIRRL